MSFRTSSFVGRKSFLMEKRILPVLRGQVICRVFKSTRRVVLKENE
jgi:hypothetical protein